MHYTHLKSQWCNFWIDLKELLNPKITFVAGYIKQEKLLLLQVILNRSGKEALQYGVVEKTWVLESKPLSIESLLTLIRDHGESFHFLFYNH